MKAEDGLGMKGKQPEADSRSMGESRGREDELEQSRTAHIHENAIIELSVLYVSNYVLYCM